MFEEQTCLEVLYWGWWNCRNMSDCHVDILTSMFRCHTNGFGNHVAMICGNNTSRVWHWNMFVGHKSWRLLVLCRMIYDWACMSYYGHVWMRYQRDLNWGHINMFACNIIMFMPYGRSCWSSKYVLVDSKKELEVI